MPQDERDHTYHKVNLKMRLSARSEWIESTILRLGNNIILALHQTLVYTRKANKLEKTATEWTCPVLFVCGDRASLGRSISEEVIIQSQIVLEHEDVGNNGVIQQVLAD